MQIIPLRQSQYVMVDDDVYPWLALTNWHGVQIGHTAYARTRRAKWLDGPVWIYMHRLIMNAGASLVVDHIDGDGLNNQRSNLRVTTPALNSVNRRKSEGTTSKYRGVSLHSRGWGWIASIRPKGRDRHLGYFETEEEAAHAYDKAALEVWGEYARLNFPCNTVPLCSK